MSNTEHEFAQYIRAIGKGKKGSRALDFDEAENAMGMILSGQVEDLQLGAFLMLLRVKEESAAELAGFVSASRKAIQAPAIKVDLDWSSYAGKRRHNPWFLLAAFALANQGYRVFMHGSQGHTAGRLYTQNALQQLGMSAAQNWQQVETQLEQQQFAFLPTQAFAPKLEQMLMLKPLVGLRTVANTLCRLLNPLAAEYSVQSIFHPAYAEKHCQAQAILGQANAMVIKGDGGEFERRPEATSQVLGLRQSESFEQSWPKLVEGKQDNELMDCQLLLDLWHNKQPHAYGQQAVLGTLALVLAWMKNIPASEALPAAVEIWHQRQVDFLPEFIQS